MHVLEIWYSGRISRHRRCFRIMFVLSFPRAHVSLETACLFEGRSSHEIVVLFRILNIILYVQGSI